MELSEASKATLLKLARESITAAVTDAFPPLYGGEDPSLNTPCGVFVTLKKEDKLRGCIGYIHALDPLFKVVIDVAASAATQDYRFSPVTEDELPDIDIEISVLSPLRQIKDINEIEIGKHGIYLEKNYWKGLLLPQVAKKYHWNTQQFLEQTCVKAGLPHPAWKDPETKIMIFSAEIFNEREINLLKISQ